MLVYLHGLANLQISSGGGSHGRPTCCAGDPVNGSAVERDGLAGNRNCRTIRKCDASLCNTACRFSGDHTAALYCDVIYIAFLQLVLNRVCTAIVGDDIRVGLPVDAETVTERVHAVSVQGAVIFDSQVNCLVVLCVGIRCICRHNKGAKHTQRKK